MYGWTRIGRRLLLVALTTTLPTFLGASLALLPSCKQGENERCQIDDDCGTDYVCYLGGNTPVIGGICRSKFATNNPTPDLATPPVEADMSMPDMAPADM
jgi:hypothetical protein